MISKRHCQAKFPFYFISLLNAKKGSYWYPFCIIKHDTVWQTNQGTKVAESDVSESAYRYFLAVIQTSLDLHTFHTNDNDGKWIQ